MASNDKKVTIEVGTEVDLSDVEDLEDLIDKIGDSTVEIPVETSNIEDLEAEIEALNEELAVEEAYDLDTSETEAKLEELKSKIEEVNNTPLDFDDTEAQADIDNLTSGLDTLTSLQVGEVLQSYGSGAEAMAQGLNEGAIGIEQLAHTAGTTEQQMRSLITSISNETFPINEATAYTQALVQMGTRTENLGQQATNIDKINDAFGLGAQNTQAMVQELNVLGVSSNNLESSFNSLAYANRNTIGGMAQYKTMLQRFNVDFKEAGMNADQTAIAIAGATHKFGGGRAAMSNLSSALKEANGDLTVLEQKLGLQAGALSHASEITGQYEGQLQALADEEMEHKTLIERLTAGWNNFAQANQGVITSLGSLVGMGGEITGFGAKLNGLWEFALKLQNTTALDTFRAKLGEIGTMAQNTATKLSNLAGTTINTLKTSLISLGGKIREVGTALLTMGRNALISGANAVRSAVMWGIQKTALIASTIYTYALSAAQAILNVVMSLNPVMILVIAIMALVGALIWAYYNVDEFRKFVDGLWQSIQDLINGFIGWVQDGINQFANAVNGIPQAIQDCLDWAYQLLMNHPIVQAAIWLGEQIANGFSAIGLGQHSPGKIVQSMTQELDWTQKAIEDSRLAQSSSQLGNQVSKGFNPNLNSVSGGNTGNNITINIENVDNEERVQQIVKAVEKALKFDNLTAGRTV